MSNVRMSEMDTEIRHSPAGRRTGVSRRSAICRAPSSLPAIACRDVCCLPVLLPLFHSIHAVSRIPVHDELQLLSPLPSWPRPRSIHPSNDDASEDDRQQPRVRDQAIVDVLGLEKFVHCLGTILL